MNPESNKFEALKADEFGALLRPDGRPVPKHWATFQLGEEVVIKGYTFRVAYIGEAALLFEPVAIAVVGEDPTVALEKRLQELQAEQP